MATVKTNSVERFIKSIIPTVYESLTGLSRPLWRDISRHQGRVNFNVMVDNNVYGVASRAAVSWGYKDPMFPRNWSEAGSYGLYRTSYFAIYPDQDVVRQADNWYSAHPTIDIIPRVIDLEVRNDAAFYTIAAKTMKLSDIVLARDGVRPIIYSRTNLVNSWLRDWSVSELNDHYWWLAQYLKISAEHPGPPTKPERVDVDRIILHQTSDHKLDFPGEAEGSKQIDWDRWLLGDVLDMHAWISKTFGGNIPVDESNVPISTIKAQLVSTIEEMSSDIGLAVDVATKEVVRFMEQL